MVRAMKLVALSELKDDLSQYLRMAEHEEIVITSMASPQAFSWGSPQKTIGSTIGLTMIRVSFSG